MKLFSRSVLYTCLTLLLFCTIAPAMARDAGPSLCYSQWNILRHSGFSQNAVYTADGIMQLLARADVRSIPAPYLIRGERYQVEYTCYEYHELSHNTLHAMPLSADHHHYVTNIHWDKSK